MKSVKKILRLLPLFLLLSYFLAIIFNKNGYSSSTELVLYLDIESGFIDSILDTFRFLVPTDFLNWFSNNVSSNYFIQFSLSILFYELYLSLAFLCFDFINLIFGWANKFVKKGSNLNE